MYNIIIIKRKMIGKEDIINASIVEDNNEKVMEILDNLEKEFVGNKSYSIKRNLNYLKAYNGTKSVEAEIIHAQNLDLDLNHEKSECDTNNEIIPEDDTTDLANDSQDLSKEEKDTDNKYTTYHGKFDICSMYDLQVAASMNESKEVTEDTCKGFDTPSKGIYITSPKRMSPTNPYSVENSPRVGDIKDKVDQEEKKLLEVDELKLAMDRADPHCIVNSEFFNITPVIHRDPCEHCKNRSGLNECNMQWCYLYGRTRVERWLYNYLHG